MSLYENWMEKAFSKDGRSIEGIWEDYLPKEQRIYEYIIGEKVGKLEGRVSELAQRFGMTAEEIVAFVDGIHDAVPENYEMDTLTEDSDITLTIDFESLFTLPQWDGIFDADTRKRLTLEQKKSRTVVKGTKVGRNDPCPCGSGKKYKKCCGANL